MQRQLAGCLIGLAAIVWACGDQLPDSSGDAGTSIDGDGGGDGNVLPDAGDPSDGSSIGDGAANDVLVTTEAGACPPAPGFCEGFESAAIFGGNWAKSEGSGGVASITTDAPKEGAGALRGVASGGSGQAIAAVTKLVLGDFKSFDCTMWLRAPNGWSGSYDVVSIGTFGVGGFQQWRVSLGVATDKARVLSDATTDAGANTPVSNLGGPIESVATGGWVFARLAFSNANGWLVTGTIGGSTTSVQAPDPTAVNNAQMFVGLSRAAYASTPPANGFALDVDDLRCTVAK